MKNFIGIDIGGTNIRICSIDKKENITFMYKEKAMENVNSSEDLYNKIKNMIEKVPNYRKCGAIGIGVPGAIDLNTKKILTARNLELLINYPLVEKLEKDFKVKVYIENDAKVAAFGEAIKGAGKDRKSVCYITISTGLGGGVVINKKIYHGSNNVAGYFSRVILDGENMSEHLISGTALIKKARECISSNIQSTKEVFELSKNNESAKKIVEDFKKYLTILLLDISVTINPDMIILGGGVTKSKEYFLEDVKYAFYSKAQRLAQKTEIEIAKLDEPGVIGAALMWKRK